MSIPNIPGWQAKELYHIMYDFDRFCQDYGIDYWICCGTLIGAARHGGLIPWDDDSDVMMTPSTYKALKKMGPEMRPYNVGIVYEADFGNLMKIVRPNKPPMGPDKPWSFPWIDVFVTIKRGDKYSLKKMWRRRPSKPFYITEKELFPIRRMKFGHYDVNAPNDYRSDLVRNYGKNVLGTAVFEGHHADPDYDRSKLGKLDLKKFEPARPFYVAPRDAKKSKKKRRSRSRRRSRLKVDKKRSRRTRTKSQKRKQLRSKSRRKSAKAKSPRSEKVGVLMGDYVFTLGGKKLVKGRLMRGDKKYKYKAKLEGETYYVKPTGKTEKGRDGALLYRA